MARVRWEKLANKPTVITKHGQTSPTVVVRIDRGAYRKLFEFSKTSGVPIRVLVSRAVMLLEQNESFARLTKAYHELAEAKTEFVRDPRNA